MSINGRFKRTCERREGEVGLGLKRKKVLRFLLLKQQNKEMEMMYYGPYLQKSQIGPRKE